MRAQCLRITSININININIYIYMVPPPPKKKNLLFSWAKEVLYIWQKYAASPGDVSADGSGTKEPEVALKCGFSTAPGCFIKRPTFHHCKQRM